jgi:NAD(P)-dependent dehydrogenase (short-subunit alcohol dehydrogenase family)
MEINTKRQSIPKDLPPQHQAYQPGSEKAMIPQPVYDSKEKGCGRLQGKTAIITGGDSGIGKAIAISFAKEGANVVIVYLNEQEDASDTAFLIEAYGKEALLIQTDICEEQNSQQVVQQTIDRFGGIDIVVNNAAVQYPKESIEAISADQLEKTFTTNIFSQFYLSKYAVPHLKEGASIINTASVTAYKGNEILLDYSATKGAIISFTRSLAASVAKKGIRVNAVAPGPVWTPLIPSSFSADKVASFGKDVPLGRAAQPFEIAGCYVFLASREASFITGQVLHPNGGIPVNG